MLNEKIVAGEKTVHTISSPRIFDGHNDFMLRVLRGSVTIDDAVSGVTTGQIDLPRAAKGGFGGGFFAIWVPDSDMNAHSNDKQMAHATYDLPLPDRIGWDDAIRSVVSEVAIFTRLAAAGFH